MFAQIKMKLKKLTEEQKLIENEIRKWKLVQNEIDTIENEIILLQKRSVSLRFDAEEKISIRDQVQFLINKQLDIYWDAQSNIEKLESRKLNFVTFRKQPRFSLERYNFENALNTYTELLIEILNQDKKIWWKNFPFSTRDRYINILEKELYGILRKRNEVVLIEEEEIANMIKGLSKVQFQKRFTDTEWSNLMALKKTFEQVHIFKRESVYFF